ncbi:MAG: hypothetical protein IKP99_06625 [Bacteroidales bacterium]|nr:hypothetical protein [Bacteroidales bacterium]
MKKFKLIVGAVALCALVVANVWNAATTLKVSGLIIEEVEALAQMEEEEWQPFPGSGIFGTIHKNACIVIQYHSAYGGHTTWPGTEGVCVEDSQYSCWPWDCRKN